MRLTVLLLVMSLVPLVTGRAGDTLARKVLIIGLDGCRPDSLLAASTPNIDALAASGAWHFDGMTSMVPISGPGWSSCFTGAWSDKHGVDDNSFNGARFDLYPHVFCRLAEAFPGIRTGSIVRWAPLDPNLFRACASESLVASSDEDSEARAIVLLAEDGPDLLFVHLNSPDSVGHSAGFSPDSEEYVEAIAANDEQVGRILEIVRARPTFESERWLFIITTDHGGSGNDHHDSTPENRRIFLVVSGDGVLQGELESAPGIVDVGVTAMAFLGLAADPSWELDGAVVGWSPSVAGQLPGDCTQDGGLDLSDILCLLNHLFLQPTSPLACGEGTLASEGNKVLLDGNGDEVTDISDAVYMLFHLFLGGPPHAAGATCAPLAGCPEACL